MERLKPATEFKLVSPGNEFFAFTTRSLKKTDIIWRAFGAAHPGVGALWQPVLTTAELRMEHLVTPLRGVHRSILCDPIQPNPSAD